MFHSAPAVIGPSRSTPLVPDGLAATVLSAEKGALRRTPSPPPTGPDTTTTSSVAFSTSSSSPLRLGSSRSRVYPSSLLATPLIRTQWCSRVWSLVWRSVFRPCQSFCRIFRASSIQDPTVVVGRLLSSALATSGGMAVVRVLGLATEAFGAQLQTQLRITRTLELAWRRCQVGVCLVREASYMSSREDITTRTGTETSTCGVTCSTPRTRLAGSRLWKG